MFQRIEYADGLVVYQSDLLTQAGVLHGFSTRQAGKDGDRSSKASQEWDLAVVQATPAAPPSGVLSPGYQRFMAITGCQDYALVHVQQVHGNEVLVVDASDAGHPDAADGLVTTQPGVALSIRIADCVPLLMVASMDGKAKAVAAVHAGWRGLVAGIIPQAVRILHQQVASDGEGKARIVCAIGPCISRRHFEVGPEVAQAFVDANLAAAVQTIPQARPHVDLSLAARLQLRSAGLSEKDTDHGALCTYSQPEDFFSHRRDHGQTGRLAAMIALRKA